MTSKPVAGLKIDPSGIKQRFYNINIQLHCCRYWKFKKWEFTDLAVPFWRVYFNTIPGAHVFYHGKSHELTSEKLMVIPPDTSFSTSISTKKDISKPEYIEGESIKSPDEIHDLSDWGMVDHFFIHFNLGTPFDMIEPGIYEFQSIPALIQTVDIIKAGIFAHQSIFEIHTCMNIYQLILGLVSRIPDEKWNQPFADIRLKNMLTYMERHLQHAISNRELAQECNMAANSFLRWFKNSTGYSPQKYIRMKRIEKACHLMHHTHKGIKTIAEECGFHDRHYFTRVFKNEMNVTPAYYRKHLVIP